MKILVAEDAEGRVWISWNDPAFLQRRHEFPPELEKNIAVVEALVTKAGSSAQQKGRFRNGPRRRVSS
jgi:hypothetical protein